MPVKINKQYRYQAIAIICIIVIAVPISYFIIIPFIKNEVNRISQRPPPILLSTTPQQVNLTIEGNNTVSKRISLSFGDYIVKLLPPKAEVPPNIDKNLTFIYNNSVPTKQYFVYIVANNSKHIFPVGNYEGIIRFYYNVSKVNGTLNKAIPLDINIVKNSNHN